jgi:hypothetical protein
MGLIASWIGFQGVSKEQLLRELGLRETEEIGDFEALASPFSLGQLPNGWLILYANDLEWADARRVLDLSRLGMTVGCQFDDKTDMFSTCSAARSGAQLWDIVHKGGEAGYEIAGEPPAEFDEIRSKCLQAQEADGGMDSNTDFLFDAPLILAHLSAASAMTRAIICPFKVSCPSKAVGLRRRFWRSTRSVVPGCPGCSSC